MRLTIQLIQNFYQQDIPCVAIYLNDQNQQYQYLFNIPESTQRFAKFHKLSYIKGAKIFLTRLSPINIGGLLGLMCTLFSYDLTENNKIYGPPSTVNFISRYSSVLRFNKLGFGIYSFFIGEKILGIKLKNTLSEFDQRKDVNIILNNTNQFISQYFNDQIKYQQFVNDPEEYINNKQIFLDQKMKIIPILFKKQNQKQLLSEEICCYALVHQKIKGKIIKEKIQQLNIPNKLIKILIDKGQVKLDDGRIIYDYQIKESSDKSKAILILDIPDQEFLQIIINSKNSELINFYQQNILQQDEYLLSTIVHLGPREVVNSQEYQDWILKNFDNKCENIFTNCLNRSKNQFEINIQKQIEIINHQENKKYKLQSIFQQLYPQIFKFDQQHFKNYYSNLFNYNGTYAQQLNYYQSYNFCEFVLFPQKNYGYQIIDQVIKDFNEKINKLQQKQQLEIFQNQEDSKEWEQLAQKLKQLVINPQDTQIEQKGLASKQLINLQQLDYKNNQQKIIFLGTGSMMPMSKRNVSGILIINQIDNNNNILLDCGEGTYYQIIDHFGEEMAKKILANICIIHITHAHLDHNLGLILLIYKRQIYIKELVKTGQKDVQPLFIVIPYNLSQFILSLQDLLIDDIINEHIHILFHQDINQEQLKQLQDLNELPDYEDINQYNIITQQFKKRFNSLNLFLSQLNYFGINKYVSIPMDHCPQAYGISIQFTNGFKISFTGDSRPCENFIKASYDADILIHEGTYSDDLIEKAKDHQHSCIVEAINSAIQANAKYLIITHFSQRYQVLEDYINLSRYNEIQKNYIIKNTILAFDHLEVDQQFLPLLPAITMNCQKIFTKKKE